VLFVGDHLADFGEVLLELGDLLGPGAFGVGIGLIGGEATLGFGETLGDMGEALLQGRATHEEEPITLADR